MIKILFLLEYLSLLQDLETARIDALSSNTELSAHVQTSEERITQLESTLSVSRQESEKLSNQLRDEKQTYDRQLNQKDEFVSINICMLILHVSVYVYLG